MPDLPHVRRKWQAVGQLWPILAAACFGLVVAICAWFAVSIWEERLSRAKFNDTAQDYAEVLQNGLDDYLSKIIAVRAFFESSVEVEPEEFALFTNQILKGETGKMRILWCPHVTRAQRAEFERAQVDKGLTGYAIKTWTAIGDPSLSPEGDEYFPVLYSTVASKATGTLGMDLNSEPVRSRAIQRARDENAVAAAQNLTLRNPIGGIRRGFLFFDPVYKSGAPIVSKGQRHNNILGVVVGVFQTNAVMDAILSTATLPQDVNLYLYPAGADTDAMPVYSRGMRGEPAEPRSQADLAGLPSWSGPVKAGDAHWNLVVVQAGGGLVSYYRSWLVFAAVILVFGAVLTYMWASLRHALRLESANSKILELAQTDLLTNLANQPRFHQAADHGVQCELARRSAPHRVEP